MASIKLQELTNEQLADELDMLPALERHIKAVKAMAYARAVDGGQEIPGFKVVEGRAGNRSWVSEREAEATMRDVGLTDDDIFDKRIVSPARIDEYFKVGILGEKKHKQIQSVIEMASKTLNVVPASDRRPAFVVGGAADLFADLDNNIDDLI